MKWKEFKIGDFTIKFETYENLPQYDALNIAINQGGYYGADTDIDLNGVDLDEFLNECIKFKQWKDAR